MEKKFSLRHKTFFTELLRYKDTICLCLTVYLKMHSIKNIEKDLIALIMQIKYHMKNNGNKPLKYEFHTKYCALIENVITNFEVNDLKKNILDNYAIAQISLCSIIVQWIKTKQEVILSDKEIANVFNSVHKFIEREYGEEFFELTKIIGLYDKNDVQKICEPIDALTQASIIIKNFHPTELNGSINAFILKTYSK